MERGGGGRRIRGILFYSLSLRFSFFRSLSFFFDSLFSSLPFFLFFFLFFFPFLIFCARLRCARIDRFRVDKTAISAHRETDSPPPFPPFVRSRRRNEIIPLRENRTEGRNFPSASSEEIAATLFPPTSPTVPLLPLAPPRRKKREKNWIPDASLASQRVVRRHLFAFLKRGRDRRGIDSRNRGRV